jgi:hypothetical protein
MPQAICDAKPTRTLCLCCFVLLACLPACPVPSGLHHKPRPAVLFAFGEHAREVITPEVGIWLARILVDANSSVYTWPELSAAFERAAVDADGRSINSSSSTTAGAASNTSSSKQDWPTVIRGWVSQLSEALEIVIVPIEALDSRRLVESGQLCVRKTASNVDLNRWVGRVSVVAAARAAAAAAAAALCVVGSRGWQQYGRL